MVPNFFSENFIGTTIFSLKFYMVPKKSHYGTKNYLIYTNLKFFFGTNKFFLWYQNFLKNFFKILLVLKISENYGTNKNF